MEGKKEEKNMAKFCPKTGARVVYLACRDCDGKGCSIEEMFALIVDGEAGSGYIQDRLDVFLSAVIKDPKYSGVLIITRKGNNAVRQYAVLRGLHLHEIDIRMEEYGERAEGMCINAMHALAAVYPHRGCVVAGGRKEDALTQMHIKCAKERQTPFRICREDKKQQ